MDEPQARRTRLQQVALLLGPALGILTPLLLEIPEHPRAPSMLGIVLWMAIWWLTECVPLAVTALIPLIAFLSMWVSNTATTLLMVTIGMAVLTRLDKALGAQQGTCQQFPNSFTIFHM